MIGFLEISLAVALLATAVVLFMGIFHLFQKKKPVPGTSNRLMRLRVLFQAIALGILAILFFIRK